MAEVVLSVDKKGHAHTVTWEGLTTNDTGSNYENSVYQDKYVQVTGDFGSGATCTMQGSNDGTNWASLVDPQGNAIAFTAAGAEQLLENPRYIRPSVTSGTSPDLDIKLHCVQGGY